MSFIQRNVECRTKNFQRSVLTCYLRSLFRCSTGSHPLNGLYSVSSNAVSRIHNIRFLVSFLLQLFILFILNVGLWIAGGELLFVWRRSVVMYQVKLWRVGKTPARVFATEGCFLNEAEKCLPYSGTVFKFNHFNHNVQLHHYIDVSVVSIRLIYSILLLL